MAVSLDERVHVSSERRPPDVAAYLRTIQDRVSLLEPRDRVLLDLVPTGQRSLREAGRLLGADPGSLCRRLRAVWKRLHDPFVAHLLDPRCTLPPEHRQVALERYLMGMNTPAIADRHRLTAHQARSLMVYIRGYAMGKGLIRTRTS